MTTKIQMPNFRHKWRHYINSDISYSECACCLTRQTNPPEFPYCPEAILLWGLQMREAGAEVERSAIVAYLIDRAEDVRSTPTAMDILNQLATEIESLEHNKEN